MTMTHTQYEHIAELISQIRNARFGQMVSYLEELIATGIWQNFTTPDGTHFEFRACEFDYFLAAMEIDPDVVKRAYIHAKDIDDLAAKQDQLANITGRGAKPADGERRDPKEIAVLYGDRILRYPPVVTDNTARRARTSAPSRARNYWTAEWTGDASPLKAITAKLLADPELAHEVYKILHAADSARRYEHKRRSEA